MYTVLEEKKKARVGRGDQGGRVGCDRWSAGVTMGGADSDDEMGMGLDDEYGLGWNGEVAPSRRKTDREAKASRARAGVGVATVATYVTASTMLLVMQHEQRGDPHLALQQLHQRAPCEHVLLIAVLGVKQPEALSVRADRPACTESARVSASSLIRAPS